MLRVHLMKRHSNGNATIKQLADRGDIMKNKSVKLILLLFISSIFIAGCAPTSHLPRIEGPSDGRGAIVPRS